MLPNFLGIGAQRCGTSWLDMQLRRHPQIYLPTARKEVHFFDDNYDRGMDWYRQFFKNASGDHLAVGEITPKYVLVRECRDRILDALGPATKFVVMLRNPADRAFSQYTAFSIAAGEGHSSFRAFLEQVPDAVERGFYGRQLAFFSEVFPQESILTLVYEEVHASQESELQAIASICVHLGVDPDRIAKEAIGERFGVSTGPPRFPSVFRSIGRVKRWLRKNDFEFMIRMGKTMGLKRAFFRRHDVLPKLSLEDRRSLDAMYRHDTRELEAWLKKDLSVWKRAES